MYGTGGIPSQAQHCQVCVEVQISIYLSPFLSQNSCVQPAYSAAPTALMRTMGSPRRKDWPLPAHVRRRPLSSALLNWSVWLPTGVSSNTSCRESAATMVIVYCIMPGVKINWEKTLLDRNRVMETRVTPSSLFFLCGYFLSFAEYGYGYSVNYTFCDLITILSVSIRT